MQNSGVGELLSLCIYYSLILRVCTVNIATSCWFVIGVSTRTVGTKDPNFGSVLHALKVSHKITRRRDQIRFTPSVWTFTFHGCAIWRCADGGAVTSTAVASHRGEYRWFTAGASSGPVGAREGFKTCPGAWRAPLAGLWYRFTFASVMWWWRAIDCVAAS